MSLSVATTDPIQPRNRFNLAETQLEQERSMAGSGEALNNLATIDSRKAHVVELRFFGGLSVDETAEVLKISLQRV